MKNTQSIRRTPQSPVRSHGRAQSGAVERSGSKPDAIIDVIASGDRAARAAQNRVTKKNAAAAAGVRTGERRSAVVSIRERHADLSDVLRRARPGDYFHTSAGYTICVTEVGMQEIAKGPNDGRSVRRRCIAGYLCLKDLRPAAQSGIWAVDTGKNLDARGAGTHALYRSPLPAWNIKGVGPGRELFYERLKWAARVYNSGQFQHDALWTFHEAARSGGAPSDEVSHILRRIGSDKKKAPGAIKDLRRKLAPILLEVVASAKGAWWGDHAKRTLRAWKMAAV